MPDQNADNPKWLARQKYLAEEAAKNPAPQQPEEEKEPEEETPLD